MTREEYVRSLVDQNIPGDQWFDLVKKFESENPQPVEVVEEGKTTDSSQANPSEESSSEVTDSNSEDGSLELSEQDDEPVDYTSTDVKEKTEEEIQKEAFDKITAVAKPGEKFTEKQYDYKYEIVPGEKQPQYYAKEKDSTEWKLQSNDASLNVASLFGHNNLDRSEYYKSNKTLKGSREVLRLGEEFEKSGQNVGGDTKENPMFAVVSEAYNSKIKLTDKEELIILEKAKKFSSAPVINVTRYEEEFDKYNTRNESGLIKVEKNYTVNCAGPDGQNYDECKDWIGDHNAAIAEVAKSQRISRDSINLDDPKTQELINSKMTALAADRFEDKKEKRKLKNWIDSVPSNFNAKAMGQWLLEMIPSGPVSFDTVDAKDVWDRGQLQKQMESYQKDKKFKITKKQEGISEYLNKGGVVLDSISNSYKAVSNGEYQTASQVAKANKTLKALSKQRNDVIATMREKQKELDLTLEESEDASRSIGQLERNHSLVPILINNAENSAITMGQGVERMLFEVANLPNTIQELSGEYDAKKDFIKNNSKEDWDKLSDAEQNDYYEKGKEEGKFEGTDFQAFNPFWQFAGKYAVNAWGVKRDDLNKGINNYKSALMEDVAEGLTIDELETGSDWGQYLFQTTGAIIPQMALLVGTSGFGGGLVGLGSVTLSAGGGKMDGYDQEIKQSKKEYSTWEKNKPKPLELDPDASPEQVKKEKDFYKDQLKLWSENEPERIHYNSLQMWGGAMTSMGAEFAAGRLISLPMINRAKAFKGTGVKVGFTKEFGKKFLNRSYGYFGDLAMEGGEEVFSEGAGNLYDRMVLGKDVNIFSGWKDNFFSGIMMANGFKAPGLFAPYINAASTPGDKQNIENIQNKTKALIDARIQNPKMSKTTIELLDNDIAQNTVELQNLRQSTMNRYSEMPRVDIDALGSIEQQQAQIDKQVEAVKNDEGIEVGKEKLLESLENKSNNLSGQKNKILEPYVKKDAEGITTGEGSLVNPTSRQIQEGSEVVINQLGDTGITRFDTTEDLLGGLETLKAQGIQLEVNRDPDTNQILPAEDQGYGLVATLPNGTKQIIINNASSEADGSIPADKHEAAHVFASKMDPAKKLKMGQDLYDSLQNDKNITVSEATTSLLNQYKKDLDDGIINEADFFEEVMTVTSDALTPNSKGVTGIQVKEVSALEAIGNKILETIGWKQSFKDGNQVLDFLKGFNKDVLSGKGLSQETLDTAGVTLDEVDMGLNDDAVDLGTVKSSKVSQAKNQKLVREAKRGDLKAVDSLIKDNSGIILQKLGFNKDIGDITSQDILNVVKDQAIGKGLFKGRQKPLFENYNPTKGEVSTYLGDIVGKRKAEIFKAAGLDATKFDTVSTDAPQAQQVADTTEQSEFDEVTNEETGRNKVYPSQMESISKNIKPESIVSIKESAKRDILLNGSKGVDAIVASIKSEGKNIAKTLGKDVGTFAKGWPKFVNELVKDGLTKVIPAPALKRRFGSVLNIKKTGTTPTKKVNPTTGKVTTFNKPVYEIPKADNQALIDYFTGQEKRRTSLLEVLGQDLVVEQLQELKNDSDFMTKLDSLTGGKALEIIDSVDSKLDTRNLEDTSLDTVKASKKKIKPLDVKVLESKVAEVMQTSGINDVKSALDIKEDITVTSKNRASRVASVLDTIISGKIPAPALELLKLQNFGASRKQNSKGVYYYDLTNGQTIIGTKGFTSAGKVKYTLPTQEAIDAKYGPEVTIKPSRGSLYYGKTDINYQTAIEAAELNNKFYGSDVISNLKNAQRVTIKSDSKLDTKSKKKRQAQEAINMNALNDFVNILNTGVQSGQIPLNDAALLVAQAYQGTTGLIKIAAPFEGVSNVFEKAPDGTKQATRKIDFIEEHSPPASSIGAAIIAGLATNNISEVMQGVRDNFVQVQLSNASDVLIDRAGFSKTLPKGISILTPNAGYIRLSASGINMNGITDLKSGKSVAELMNVGVRNKASKKNPNIVNAQNSLINEQAKQDDAIDSKTAQARIKAYEPIAALELESGKINVDNLGEKINVEMTIADQLTMLATYDKAARNARAIDAPKKGISVFDFDDTLARTKEKVIVNNADGSSTEISAAKFAETAGELEANGATFDFANFEGVADGTKKGPLADLALKRQDKFGSKDIFVLTARPQASAQAIKTFLDGIGLNLPISNITGLANGTPGAKGNWVAGKAAEGYNDFYFADDAYKNVEAVQEVLSQVDVDSEVQIAKASKKKVFNQVFNDIIENSTGIESYKVYSPAKAETIGASKGKFDFLIPPSAEDFTGLLYKTLGKGKVGDAQMAFYKTNLLDPYNRAEIAVVNAKIQAANDFKALKSNLKTLPKSLSKLTGIGKFTFSQAARVAVWTRQGMTVPGLSKTDLKQLNDFVDNNAELNTFADELIKIQKGKPYPSPTKTWVSGTITSDITTEIDKVNRKEYMQEFQENADIMFSDENMAKLEAAYGPRYVEALKDSLRRMKSGSNRPLGGSRVVNNVLDWLNNSVGAVMFLNTRSAILQTLSAVNFIQVSGPNNILAAGKAFANQKQYWSDFMTLMNSPYLVERRNGLKINVSESEIADAVAESKNKPKAALAYLLSKGFVMTRFADSFAIASGGSTFYRNTVDALVKSGMDQKSAEKQAFNEFRALAEESQQSSNPSKISQQQASAAGRVILAFANTPMQYARIIKKSSQDLLNGRGDWKSNVSKIAYYGAMQNVVFNALQQALFALAFSDDDEEEKETQRKDKQGRIINGMVDSLLKGAGIGGQAVASLKNALMTIAEEADKKSPEFEKAVDDLLGFSPPLSAKIRKIKGGLKAFSWNRKEMKEKGFDLNNPAYLASAQVISGLTNLPVDRAIKKLNNIRAIFSDSSAKWQKVAMSLGWSTWDVGLPFYGVEDKEIETPETILRDKVVNMKKDTTTKEQKQMLLDLGLTRAEIKKLKYEEERVKKIIALQNKKKK